MPATADRHDPFAAFNFRVDIDGITVAGFSECSGLTTETDIIEYREGNEDITVRKLPGQKKYANIVLKRGYTTAKRAVAVAQERPQRPDRPALRVDHPARRGAQAGPGVELPRGLAVQMGGTGPQRQEQRGRDRDARDLPRGPGAGMTIPVTAGAAARAPGVSVEWVSADVPVPAAVRTDVAGFVGLAPRGPAHQPVRLTSWSQFQAVFGGYDPRCWLAYAVNGYFANGADACWVVRVVDPATALPATALLTSGLVPGSGAGSGQPVLQATAISPGRWAQGARLTTADLGSGRFSLTVDLPGTREIWPELSLDDTDAQFYGTILNDPARGSQIVNLAGPAGASVGTGTVTLSGGADGLAGLQSGHFTGDLSTADGRPCGLGALDAVEEVGLVVVPDAVGRAAPAAAGEPPPRLTPDQTACLYNALLVSCASHRRFALLDEPSAQDLPADALAWALTLRQGTTAAAFGALGYPWLLVADPLAEPGAVLPVPGSGHLAGVFACTDLTVGVHKAPANATVVGALDVAWLVDVATHGQADRRLGQRDHHAAGPRHPDHGSPDPGSGHHLGVRQCHGGSSP